MVKLITQVSKDDQEKIILMRKAKTILKGLPITHEELAKKLECCRNTMYRRFNDGNWKASQRKVLKKFNLI
jgi:DNA invertase Pin-like site-specific DNA recombinase